MLRQEPGKGLKETQQTAPRGHGHEKQDEPDAQSVQNQPRRG